ncbi:MAG: chalcone isomerase family protein [Betaproteobacteria bacterium]|nr:chalcone isomerase family protein [Betaproteobacteria bacterium]
MRWAWPDWRCRLAVLALMLLAAAPATASAPEPEARVRPQDTELFLNGHGKRNFLFFDIYQVALYLPRRQHDARAVLDDDLPRRVRILTLRELSAERDMEFLLQGLRENNSAAELAAIRPQLDQFSQRIREMGTLRKGSVVILDYLPREGTRIWLNQRYLDAIPGAAFNRALLKIWLGEQPTQASLKRALLGLAGESDGQPAL